MSTRPGWYPDPSGRFPKRWYDGADWTASVLDASGQQSYDQLPPAGTPQVAAVPAAPRPSAPPPPPPGASTTPEPSPWAPAASWQSPQSPARPYTPTTPSAVWQSQQPVTTASLGLTPPPPVRSSGSGRNPLVYGLVLLGLAGIVLSMFVLDWYSEGGQSFGFRDFGEGSIASSAPFLDKLAFWNFKWLGFVVAGMALLTVFVFVVARAGSHRLGHVLAAIDVTIGAVLSTFAIVRLFRPDGFDPEIGAWLLPAGYLVVLVAVVVSSRNEPA